MKTNKLQKRERMKPRRKIRGMSLQSEQIDAASRWAQEHNVSFSSLASTTINLLCGLPLKGRELIVEAALRELLNAPQSASEAQIVRRLDALESENARLRSDMNSLLPGGAPAQQVHDHSQTTNHVNQGDVVAKTAFINPSSTGDKTNKP
jgi:hypothetical protein